MVPLDDRDLGHLLLLGRTTYSEMDLGEHRLRSKRCSVTPENFLKQLNLPVSPKIFLSRYRLFLSATQLCAPEESRVLFGDAELAAALDGGVNLFHNRVHE